MLASIALLGISYVFVIVLYRLKLHPLAKYPGPVFAKVTDWYNVYHSWKGDRHVQLHRLHQQHGPVVRFGPNRISFSTPSSLHSIYGARSNTRKAEFYQIWEQLFGAPSTATLLHHDMHAPRKRILQNAFSDSALRDMEENVIEKTRIFCKTLETPVPASSVEVDKPQSHEEPAWNNSWNISSLAGFLFFDIMGIMVFSQSFKMQSEEGNRSFVDLSLDALRGLNTVGYMPMLLKLKLDKILFSELNAGMERYKVYCAEESQNRVARQHEMKTRDVWSELITAKDPATGQGFTTEDLQSEAAILISAGSHPMRITLSALLFYLLHNPACKENLAAELRSKFPDVEDIRSGPTLTSCHYLRACITEALRLCPSIPGAPLRTALKGGVTVDGEHFPAGTELGTSIYALQHNGECYTEPFSFIPERWLLPTKGTEEDDPRYATQDSLNKARAAFCAFSVGPMACLGKNVAYHQVSIVMARVIWLFEIRLAQHVPEDGGGGRIGGAKEWAEVGEYAMNDKFSAEGDGPWIQVRRRA